MKHRKLSSILIGTRRYQTNTLSHAQSNYSVSKYKDQLIFLLEKFHIKSRSRRPKKIARFTWKYVSYAAGIKRDFWNCQWSRRNGKKRKLSQIKRCHKQTERSYQKCSRQKTFIFVVFFFWSVFAYVRTLWILADHWTPATSPSTTVKNRSRRTTVSKTHFAS